MDNINIVDAAIAQDKEAFMQAFNAAIINKVSDALELKKVEVASTLINKPEEVATNELEAITTEVDGTESDSSASNNAE
jgi:hypothetical protein